MNKQDCVVGSLSSSSMESRCEISYFMSPKLCEKFFQFLYQSFILALKQVRSLFILQDRMISVTNERFLRMQ